MSGRPAALQSIPLKLPVADTTALVRGSSDATKQVRIEADGITTGTTRVITMPDQNVDLTPNTGTFEASDAGLTSIAGLTTAANKGIYTTALDAYATYDLTSVARTLLAQTTQPLMLTAGLGFSANGASLVVAADYSAMRTLLGLGTVALLAADTDGTLAANSDSRVATQKAVKTYVDASVVGLLEDKGNLDCSGNPNYPAANKGDVYTVSGPGKIGGGSGVTVEVGDVFRALADNAGGTQASVGTSWAVVQANLVGALVSGGALGTPSSGTLSSCTGLPVAGISGLGSGVATVLATPSSANLAAAVTDETGTGALVFGTGPTLVGSMAAPVKVWSTGTTAAVGTGGTISLGGNTNNTAPTYPFAYLLGAKESASADNYAGFAAIHTISGGTNGESNSANYERLRVTSAGDLLLGTTAVPTANRGKCFVLGDNGSSDPTLGANTCAIYQKSGEIYHMDAAGNVTLTSPHAIDEAIASGLDIPDDDMHPSIGKSYNVYTGYGTYTYRDQVVAFQIPAEEKRDWTESQLAAALAREQERFEYEVAKSIHAEGDSDEPFEREKPVDYVPVDPPRWLQKRGVPTVDRKRVSEAVSEVKAELIAEVPVRVEQFRAEKAAAEEAERAAQTLKESGR